jgi:hypothetical protein
MWAEHMTIDVMFALFNEKANRAAIRSARTIEQRKRKALSICRKAKLNMTFAERVINRALRA